jgi:hypothetical protein
MVGVRVGSAWDVREPPTVDVDVGAAAGSQPTPAMRMSANTMTGAYLNIVILPIESTLHIDT